MARLVTTEIRRRGFFGKLFKFIFVLFNLAMGAWVIAYWWTVGSGMNANDSGAAQVGSVLGVGLGTGILLVFWLVGAGILGSLALVTRGRKILVQEETD